MGPLCITYQFRSLINLATLSATDAFRQDPASLNGEREQDCNMESVLFRSLIVIPGCISVVFMAWFFVMFLKASGKR